MVEALKGQSGYIRLSRLHIETYEDEEYLLFSGFEDSGKTLDQETCEKLFSCGGVVEACGTLDNAATDRLTKESKRHTEATISRSLDANSKHFNQARERLERWAEDSVLAAEQAIKDTKEQIKALRRLSRCRRCFLCSASPPCAPSAFSRARAYPRSRIKVRSCRRPFLNAEAMVDRSGGPSPELE